MNNKLALLAIKIGLEILRGSIADWTNPERYANGNKLTEKDLFSSPTDSLQVRVRKTLYLLTTNGRPENCEIQTQEMRIRLMVSLKAAQLICDTLDLIMSLLIDPNDVFVDVINVLHDAFSLYRYIKQHYPEKD